jgi:hypothetical protein
MNIEELKKSEAEFKAKGEDFKKSIAAISEKLKTKANGDGMEEEDEDTNEDMKEMCSALAKYIDYVNSRVSMAFDYAYEVEGMCRKHTGSNHVPPLPADAMQKFLKVVGMEDRYNVMKPTIYCEASKQSNSDIIVEFPDFRK